MLPAHLSQSTSILSDSLDATACRRLLQRNRQPRQPLHLLRCASLLCFCAGGPFLLQQWTELSTLQGATAAAPAPKKAVKAKVSKPKSAKKPVKAKAAPKTAKPKVSKPKATKPKTSKPKATKPKASKPKVTKPKTSKPKVTKPKASKAAKTA